MIIRTYNRNNLKLFLKFYKKVVDISEIANIINLVINEIEETSFAISYVKTITQKKKGGGYLCIQT